MKVTEQKCYIERHAETEETSYDDLISPSSVFCNNTQPNVIYVMASRVKLLRNIMIYRLYKTGVYYYDVETGACYLR